MTISVRNVTIKGVFAENATTTIPENPVAGTSYRDDTTTKAEMNAGFPFKTIVDSSKFNEALFEYSTITKLQEKYGFIPWSNLTDYETGSFCLGTNGILYQAQQPSGPATSAINPVLDNTYTYWKNVPLGSSKNPGELVWSTIPLSDAGLHLADGSLISGNGSYARFVQYMADLASTAPDIFTTEANWQQSVTTYGVCGKYVYDSVNNTIRLPKIIGFIEGTNSLNQVGNLNEAGVPNITGSKTGMAMPGYTADSTFSGAFSGGATQQVGAYASSVSTQRTVNFDASLSNPIYGKSNTVQPQSIKVLYYVVISTSVKTDIEVDIDEIATDLNSKADLDLSNINASQSARQTIAEWSLPDFSSEIALVNTTGGFTYTTPSIGYLKINVTDGAGNTHAQLYKGSDNTGISLNSLLGSQYIARIGDTYSGSSPKICLIPVGHNETYYFVTENISRISLSFVPMRGV